MRITRAQLGDYPYPSPVTLLTGDVVSDPGNQSPTYAQCLPYMCGADSANMPAKMWCSYFGRAQALACSDPNCAPYRDQSPGCSLPQVPAALPFLPAPPPPQLPTLTPQNIVSPIPYTPVPEPVAVPVRECSPWCNLNASIIEHPLLAIALLAVAGYALYGGRKNGR